MHHLCDLLDTFSLRVLMVRRVFCSILSVFDAMHNKHYYYCASSNMGLALKEKIEVILYKVNIIHCPSKFGVMLSKQLQNV